MLRNTLSDLGTSYTFNTLSRDVIFYLYLYEFKSPKTNSKIIGIVISRLLIKIDGFPMKNQYLSKNINFFLQQHH